MSSFDASTLSGSITPNELQQLSSSQRENLIDELTESNDLTVLTSQMSSDELVNDEDVLNTDDIIKQGRLEAEEYQLKGEQITINLWQIIKRSAINLVLPFINGMMLGFGEILAHEIGFRYNWVGAKVPPARRVAAKKESKFL